MVLLRFIANHETYEAMSKAYSSVYGVDQSWPKLYV